MIERYPKYTPTGIAWLPQLPQGWECRKMKYLFNERSEKGHPEEKPLCSTQAHGVIPQSLYENRVVVVDKKGLDKLKFVKVGDFVISLRSFQGGIEIAHYQGIISAAYTILEPRDKRNSAYLRYLFKSHTFIELLQTCVTGIREGQNINYPLLAKKLLPLPPLPTQRAIVGYLDAKCGGIDRLVAAKEREVALLKELKQAMIARTVTRGVKAEGAETRPLIPSPIPWLKQLPKGWECRKMKYLFNERTEKGHPEEQSLCSTQAHGVIPQSLYENRVVVVDKKGLDKLKLVKVGDFVISLRSFQGGIEIAHYQGIISAAYTILEPRDKRNSAYFRYLFKSHTFVELLQTCVTGIREGQNINYSLLSRKLLPVPLLAEQREIVEYIERRAEKIDAAVAVLGREIAALKEYRTRLVADVVTGQRRVDLPKGGQK